MRHPEAAGRAAGAQPGDLQVHRRLHDRGGRGRGTGTGRLSEAPVAQTLRASSRGLHALWMYVPSPQESRHAAPFVPHPLICMWVRICPSAVLIEFEYAGRQVLSALSLSSLPGSPASTDRAARGGGALAAGGDCGVPAAQMDRQEVPCHFSSEMTLLRKLPDRDFAFCLFGNFQTSSWRIWVVCREFADDD